MKIVFNNKKEEARVMYRLATLKNVMDRLHSGEELSAEEYNELIQTETRLHVLLGQDLKMSLLDRLEEDQD